jgi:serine/threonine protein kinase/ribosomal protein L40E
MSTNKKELSTAVICPSCGKANPVGNLYCEDCGADLRKTTRVLYDKVADATLHQVEVQCRNCGALNPADLHKCQKCEAFMPFHGGVILKSRYKIQHCLGIGGIKALYQVEDLETHLSFAIEEYAGKEHVNEFLHSASCQLKLHHESVIEAFEIFTQAGCYFLVQEFIQGKTVDKIFDESSEPLPEPKVVEWAVEICGALEYLHNFKPPIIHRDIKPANILIAEDGKLKLIDFSIACRYPNKDAIGTPNYAPPEQYKGETEPRSDLYALGATMYHLLTKTTEFYETVAPGPVLPPRQKNPQISPEVEEVILKAMQPEPEKRFASAMEMKQALLDCLDKLKQKAE